MKTKAGLWIDHRKATVVVVAETGIEIMFPHYSSLRDGNQTTIPEPYLPESYLPPLFKFQRNDACNR